MRNNSLFFNIIIFNIILCLVYYAYSGYDALILVDVLIIIMGICYAIRIKNGSTVFILFLLTFNTFMLSNVTLKLLSGEQWLSDYSDIIRKSVVQMLTLSLIGLLVGAAIYNCTRRKGIQVIKSGNIFGRSDYIGGVQKFATVLFYISIILKFLQTLDVGLNTLQESYVAYYLSYSSSIPYPIQLIGNMNIVAFCTLFATNKNREKMGLPIFLFMLVSCVSLLGGQRNIFVLDIIMLGYCMIFANTRALRNGEKAWITKKMKILVYLLIPFSLILMTAIGSIRYGNSYNMGAVEAIRSFFESQGTQVNVIALVVEYRNAIWHQAVPYTFGSLYYYITQNGIAELLGVPQFASLYSKAYAFTGNSLGTTLFYFLSPNSLLAGKGMGSCYIAELYYDFGYWGVFIGNTLLGYALFQLGNMQANRIWWSNVLIFIIVRWIVYIPRASCLTWLINALSVTNLTTLIIIAFSGKLIQLSIRRGNRRC